MVERFFPKKFNAITISKNTAWYRDFKTLDDDSVRRHEEVHMMQYWTMSMGYKWVVFARKPSYVHPFYTRALFTMPEKN